MPSFNRVIFLGHLTADPVGKVVSDNPLAQFTVACNRRGKKKDGTINEETCFLDVEAWGAQAEIASKYLKKGDSALIEGRLRQARWQAKDGTDRTKIILVCESIILTEPKTAAATEAPPPPPFPSSGARSYGGADQESRSTARHQAGSNTGGRGKDYRGD